MKVLVGKVFSIKTNKTVLILIKKKHKNKLYDKSYITVKKIHVNDEFNLCSKNSIVIFIEVKPYSKKKFWKIIKII